MFKFKTKLARERVRRTAKRTVRNRKKKMKEAFRYLKKINFKARKDICIVCGEFNKHSLDRHHITPKKTVILCASCHRVFDKGGGIKELKSRRKNYYKYNLKIRDRY